MKAFDQEDRSTWPKVWKHSVTLPDGKVVKRNSRSMQYTHAVVAQNDEGSWGVYRWSQNQMNAMKAVGQFDYANDVRVVTVTQDWMVN